MNRCSLRLLVVVVCICTLIHQAPQPVIADDDAGQKVYKQGLKSVAFIFSPRGNNRFAIGSGSLIDAQKKLVITNEHVVGDSKDVTLMFAVFEKNKLVNDKKTYLSAIQGGSAFKGKVLHKEVSRDLAIIQLEKLPSGVMPVKFAADSPGTGASVHSIGNPGASDALWVYTPGKVRSVYKKNWLVGKERTEHNATIIEATSPTSPGDSGGPLFNDKAEQIGVTQGGIVDPTAQNFSYFIDVTEVKAFLKEKKISISSALPAPPQKEDSESTLAKDPMDRKDTVVKKESDPEKDEKTAASMLKLAKLLASNPERKVTAIESLNDLIQKYPKTKAAAEAEELVKKLKK